MKHRAEYIAIKEDNFTSFFRQHYSSFCFLANRYVKDVSEAEDIVSEAAVKVWEKLDTLQYERALKNYFYITIRNECINRLRQQKRSAGKFDFTDVEMLEEQSFVENIIHTETLRELEAGIHTLPLQCRRIIVKLFLEGKSLSETAQEMNLSLNTIKNQRQRGIKLLRRQMMPVGNILLFILQLIF